jgi:hypothetical protein
VQSFSNHAAERMGEACEGRPENGDGGGPHYRWCGLIVVVIVVGGLIAVAGVHQKVQSIHENAPAPVLGTIIVIAGMAIVALAMVSVFVWLAGRHKRNAGLSNATGDARTQGRSV